MNSTITSDTHQPTVLKSLTRVLWLLMFAVLLTMFAAGVPLRFEQLMTLVSEDDPHIFPGMSSTLEAAATLRLSAQEMQSLQAIGISTAFYAVYILAFDIVLVMVGSVIGFLIFWRRSDDWMAMWVSIILVLLGTSAVSLVIPTLASVWPGWLVVSVLFGFLGMVSNVHILFLSPDGQFVPRWTYILAAGYTGFMLVIGMFTLFIYLRSGFLTSVFTLFIATPFWLFLSGVGVLAQVYRYQQISDQVHRQQTKWVAAGLAIVMLGFFLNAYFLYASSYSSGQTRVLLNLLRAPLVNLCMVFLPLCLAISIFRYRLWDIDLLIRRTLIYGTLTAVLGAIYFGGIIVLQALFTAVTGQQSVAATVLSTLAIATLFTPLRHRIQDFIDRRFYRSKYDAEKALAEFATAARNVTDLSHLSNEMLRVAQQTLQPEAITLWLKKIDNVSNDRA